MMALVDRVYGEVGYDHKIDRWNRHGHCFEAFVRFPQRIVEVRRVTTTIHVRI